MIEYTLYRINDNETTTEVSTHETIIEGVTAGVEMVEHIDLDHAYALHNGSSRVVSFRENRTGYRAWAIKTGRLSPSVEDRYDKDVDELMV